MAGFTIKPTTELLRKRELQRGGKVQKTIDSECIRRMDKYTPLRSGSLKESAALGTVIGSGELRQTAPYVRANYYHNAGRGTEGTAHGGLRGRFWFERMKAVHKKEILKKAAELCGAEPKGE